MRWILLALLLFASIGYRQRPSVLCARSDINKNTSSDLSERETAYAELNKFHAMQQSNCVDFTCKKKSSSTDPYELVFLFSLVESLPRAFDSFLRLLDLVLLLAL